MAKSKVPMTSDGRPYLKMKAVREATGFQASTIQYYHSLGLLKETIKTSANMAYYHPDTVEDIRFIRLLKSRYRLPISKIKEMVEKKAMDENVKVISYLNELIFGPETDELVNIEKFSELTGLTEDAILEFIAIGLLVPIQDLMFDPQDVMIGKVLQKTVDMNLKPENLEFYAKAARSLVDREMAIRQELSENLSVEDNSAVTLELTQMARAFRTYVFDRTFQKRILSAIEIPNK